MTPREPEAYRAEVSAATAWPLGLRWNLTILVGLIQVGGSVGAASGQPDRRALDGLAFALLLAGPIALGWLRRAPVMVLAVVIPVTLVYLLRQYPYGPVITSAVVAAFYAVLAGHRRAAWLAAAVLYVGHFGLWYLLDPDTPPSWQLMLVVAGWMLLVLVVAEVVRARRESALEAARARDEEMRRRTGDERLRIARELHDVVAHHISLINVQAGVALHLADERPAQVRAALTTIRDASKEALVELRSILGVLRQVDEGAPRRPAPRMTRVDELVARASQAGVAVRSVVDGDPRPLPAGVELAAFRIVQEALTNVVRHARASTATVRVVYGQTSLTVEVDDDGRGTATTGTREGTGIAGMRERAAAVGGTLSAGPRSGRGFGVRAVLPLEETS